MTEILLAWLMEQELLSKIKLVLIRVSMTQSLGTIETY